MHILLEPSFFFTNSTGAPYGDALGLIHCFLMYSSSCFLNSSRSVGLSLIGGRDGGSLLVVSIRWSIRLSGGSPSGISVNTVSWNRSNNVGSLGSFVSV